MMNPQTSATRLVIISNRLPVKLKKSPSGHWQALPSSGGLVSALRPVLQRHGGLWIGSLGDAETDSDWERVAGGMLDELDSRYTLQPVRLSRAEIEGYYDGFANDVIWPLFHDVTPQCRFEPRYWRMYQRVNRKFAQVVAEAVQPGDCVWVHDYHLMGLGAELRALGVVSKIGFFLHIPFPAPDVFLNLPWRRELLQSLLAFELVALQSERDRCNFLQCVEALRLELSDVHAPVTVAGTGHLITTPARTVRVEALPIGIDYARFARRAASAEVAERAARLRTQWPGCTLMLGVDRLDYTKGLPQKFRAFRTALQHYPELRRQLSLIQHVVPSREDNAAYRRLRREIEQLVGAINGEFAEPGWTPIHYFHHSLSFDELLAYYRLADIALVTPLKDGMNLVAKEYCAAQCDDPGVLIVSEFAGCAAQFENRALLINPHDGGATAARIAAAYRMPIDERRRRMRGLRQCVQQADVFRWVEDFLRCLLEDQETPASVSLGSPLNGQFGRHDPYHPASLAG